MRQQSPTWHVEYKGSVGRSWIYSDSSPFWGTAVHGRGRNFSRVPQIRLCSACFPRVVFFPPLPSSSSSSSRWSKVHQRLGTRSECPTLLKLRIYKWKRWQNQKFRNVIHKRKQCIGNASLCLTQNSMTLFVTSSSTKLFKTPVRS